MTYQISSQDGNQVRHANTHDDALLVARAMADETGAPALVSERGASEDDYEVVEPDPAEKATTQTMSNDPQYTYTTVGEYQASHPECSGEFVGQDGEILPSDARITISSAGEWCPGEYAGNQTWEPLD